MKSLVFFYFAQIVKFVYKGGNRIKGLFFAEIEIRKTEGKNQSSEKKIGLNSFVQFINTSTVFRLWFLLKTIMFLLIFEICIMDTRHK